MTRCNMTHAAKTGNSRIKKEIAQYIKTVQRNLYKCILQDKKKALNALDIQIVAMP